MGMVKCFLLKEITILGTGLRANDMDKANYLRQHIIIMDFGKMVILSCLFILICLDLVTGQGTIIREDGQSYSGTWLNGMVSLEITIKFNILVPW